MDSDEPGSGGSTPVQDEPEYEDGGGPQTPGSSGPQSVEDVIDASDSEQGRRVIDNDDYFSDGGEVEREEVQQEVADDEGVEREEVEREVVDDVDSDEGPRSPPASPMSVDGFHSGRPSPRSGPQSPASGPQSPASGPQSPMSGSQSPASGPRSPRSAPQSPASGSRSPISAPCSPANRSQSPASGPHSPASGPHSPASGPRSPASGPLSPMNEPPSPMFSEPNSPVASPIAPNIELFLQDDSQPMTPNTETRSRSPAKDRSPDQSPSYSPRSVSPAESGPASPVGSPPASPLTPRAESDNDSGDEIRSRRPRRIISDDESDREEVDHEEKKKVSKESDDEDSGKESGADELIADIFGSSDEDEEFEGFGAADVETHAKKTDKVTPADSDEGGDDHEQPEPRPELSDDENEAAAIQSGQGEDFVSDFEMMIQRKKEERQRQRRKRKDIDMINDNDDLIADMIGKMKLAAEEDRELNKKRQAATKKLTLLPWVLSQLMKADLHSIFLDSGILSGMCEWLAPLPDKSLPHLAIREALLKILLDFPPISSDSLKMSGIGKAIMYLYKHPKELRPNKERAGKLINDWSRPIFNLTSNYKTLSREERETRDYEQLPKQRKLSMEGSQTPRRDIDNAMEGEQKALRPGDPGWVYRARVPQPSNKDYVVRPKSEIEYMAKKGGGKKEITRYEKHVRAFAEKKKFNKAQRAITISIEGRNMAL